MVTFSACTKDCQLACICGQGYLRQGESGECIPENEC